ncbi:hypothetical protein QBC36DRAFT_361206 [Triangularia setosa]|uniref:N-acetyltransferase domain-containing protein n=1 Tax=Triangularia setosa TaxID=2587417 RepID=A0AAN6WJP3_9PEZI|nr:hypothetical protein QBC36DRAFT_361206 [Podospora setosa]
MLNTALPPILEVYHPTRVPDPVLSLLQAFLPQTLPVLRRIQFAKNFAERGGTTKSSRVVHVYHPEFYNPADDGSQGQYFVTAYVDLTRWPETQVWLFSSVEVKVSGETSLGCMRVTLYEGEGRVHDGLLGGLFGFIAGLEWPESEGEGVEEIKKVVGRKGKEERKILVGSIHEVVRRRMLAMGMGLEKTEVAGGQEWEWDYKFLFRIEELPELEGEMRQERWEANGRGFYWDTVKKEDVKLVKSRTGIDRQEATLLMVPSVAVRLGATDQAVGWAFLGLDGTVMTLHVEEPYRRLGLGKAIAIKLMREHLGEYATDGYGAADVWVGNEKSQGLCRAIGGRTRWIVSWGILDLESIQNIKL